MAAKKGIKVEFIIGVKLGDKLFACGSKEIVSKEDYEVLKEAKVIKVQEEDDSQDEGDEDDENPKAE